MKQYNTYMQELLQCRINYKLLAGMYYISECIAFWDEPNELVYGVMHTSLCNV